MTSHPGSSCPRGQAIQNQAQLEALLARGAFVDIEETHATAHLHDGPGSEPIAIAGVQNLFGLWNQRADEMRKLMAKMPQAPDLPTRAAEFAEWLLELVGDPHRLVPLRPPEKSGGPAL